MGRTSTRSDLTACCQLTNLLQQNSYRVTVPSSGSDQKSLASILILSMGLGLVALQVLLAVAMANNSGLTLHIRQLDGANSRNIVEVGIKAFAQALRLGTEVDPRRAGAVPSSKGVLERTGGWSV